MSDLEARYGASRRSEGAHTQRNVPQRWWIIAVTLLILGTVGFWALTYANPSTTVEAQTVRFSQISDTEASIQARVSVQPGTALACAFEAQNEMKAVVGYKVLELPAVGEQHQVVDLTLRTTQAADIVSVRECWIPNE